MSSIESLPRVGPYVMVSRDEKRTFVENGRTFRLLLYGAYDAFGLIGSECNGICVLDEDNKKVICDEICRAGTGYAGPQERQIRVYETMMKEPWVDFQARVNRSERVRIQL